MELQTWLSPDLWIMVFEKLGDECDPLSGNHFKSVRLTCRLFEKLATQFLMPYAVCAPLSSALTTLTEVSLHPVLSKHVEEVVYICTRYQPKKSLLEYKWGLSGCLSNPLTPLNENTMPRSPLTLSEEDTRPGENNLIAGYSQYCEHYDDQSAMENSGEVTARLCSALMRMPNIKRIIISPRVSCHLKCYSGPTYFLGPVPAYDKAFLLMARVISLTGVKIQELHFEDDGDTSCSSPGVSGLVFRKMTNMDLNHCCDAFRSLRKVSIIANLFDRGWKTGNFAKILSGAIYLESLRFCGTNMPRRIFTKYIFGITTWSHLASLDFNSVYLDQGELLDLLRRHSCTLKNLYLFDIDLENGSWKTLLEGIKSSLCLQVILIEISREVSYNGDDEESTSIDIKPAALNNYLFGDGPHPLSDSTR